MRDILDKYLRCFMTTRHRELKQILCFSSLFLFKCLMSHSKFDLYSFEWELMADYIIMLSEMIRNKAKESERYAIRINSI